MPSPEKHQISLSVVIPVYGCAGCLEELCLQLNAVLPTVAERYEIVLVDDHSPDNAWAVLESLRESYPSIKAIRLSRNFGQQIAISAGLAEAKGDYAVVMDCDLQDPPGLIPKLFEKLGEGHDLVLARRLERQHSLFRVVAARAYFKLLGLLTGQTMDGSFGSFSLLTRKVIDSFLLFEERERHYLFILRWLGFSQGIIDYPQQERFCGRSSYSVFKLLKHALEGVLFQATSFLRWIVTAGFLFAVSGITAAAYLIWRAVFYTALPGWTSLVVLVLVCTGALMVSLGVIGMYVDKIFEQSKQRPLYVKDTTLERRSSW